MPEARRTFHLAWILTGWFISAAVVSLILLALTAFDPGIPDSPAQSVWVALAMAIGFFVGGAFVGWKAGLGPIVQGVSFALLSLAVWLIANLLLGEPTGTTTWNAVPFTVVFVAMLVQAISAAAGSLVGDRMSLPSDTQL